MTYHTHLPDRGVIAISGDDYISFLQGIVTNDVEKVSRKCAGYGAFLTPQGKYLHDFFMIQLRDSILLETERSRIPDFIKRLSMYKLRAQVQIEDVSEEYIVAAVFGEDALLRIGLDAVAGTVMQLPVGTIYVDPRLEEAGLRITAPHEAQILSLLDTIPTEQSKYDEHRIGLGLPDGSRDLVPEKSVLLENGFDELNGVDWDKGCYMGQEVTARTKHRGLVKKRLMPVAPVPSDGDLPEPGTAIMAGEREAGEMRSSCGTNGLAMIKLDYLDGDIALSAGGATLSPRKVSWATY